MKDLRYLLGIYLDWRSRVRIVLEWIFRPAEFVYRLETERRFEEGLRARWCK